MFALRAHYDRLDSNITIACHVGRAHLPTTPAIIDSDILQLLVFFYDFHPAQASRLEFLVQAEVRSQYKPTGDLKCALGSKLHEHVYFDSGWDAGC